MEHPTNIASQQRIYNTWQIGKQWQTFSLVFKCDPKCLSPIAPLVESSGHYCFIKSTKFLRKKASKCAGDYSVSEENFWKHYQFRQRKELWYLVPALSLS